MDLNREVAERVIRYTICFDGDIGETRLPHIDELADNIPSAFPAYAKDSGKLYLKSNPYEFIIWNPLKDMNQCFEVLAKFKYFTVTKVCAGNYSAMVLTDSVQAVSSLCKTPNEAILKAALEATTQ